MPSTSQAAAQFVRRDRGCRGTVVLDQARLRGANRRLDAETINLGNEPPLSVDGGTGGLVDRRRLSIQWFAGTILTGLCGAALMGGAVYASLDGETNFASAPEHVELSLRGALASGRLSGIHKTDRHRRCQRIERRAPDRAGADQHAGPRARTGTHPHLCARHRQSCAVAFGNLRQHSAVQPAKALDRRRGEYRRAAALGRAGRRGDLRHLRFLVRRAPNPKRRRRCATSIRCCRKSNNPRCCRSRKSSPACATSPAKPQAHRYWPTPTRAQRPASG